VETGGRGLETSTNECFCVFIRITTRGVESAMICVKLSENVNKIKDNA